MKNQKKIINKESFIRRMLWIILAPIICQALICSLIIFMVNGFISFSEFALSFWSFLIYNLADLYFKLDDYIDIHNEYVEEHEQIED